MLKRIFFPALFPLAFGLCGPAAAQEVGPTCGATFSEIAAKRRSLSQKNAPSASAAHADPFAQLPRPSFPRAVGPSTERAPPSVARALNGKDILVASFRQTDERASATRVAAAGPEGVLLTNGLFPGAKRIAIFPGSFDPPHPMHREIILRAIKQYELDAVVVQPVANYMRKPNASPMGFREALARAGLGDIPQVRFPDDTLKGEMLKVHPSQWMESIARGNPRATVYSLSGVDVLEEASEFKVVKGNNVRYLFATRPGSRSGDELAALAREKGLPVSQIDVIKGEDSPWSSTKIRREIAEGRIPEFFNAREREIIEREQLYRPEGNLRAARIRLAEVERELATGAEPSKAADLRKLEAHYQEEIRKADSASTASVATRAPEAADSLAAKEAALRQAEIKLQAALADDAQIASSIRGPVEQRPSATRVAAADARLREAKLEVQKLTREAGALRSSGAPSVSGATSGKDKAFAQAVRNFLLGLGPNPLSGSRSLSPEQQRRADRWLAQQAGANERLERLARSRGISSDEVRARALSCLRR